MIGHLLVPAALANAAIFAVATLLLAFVKVWCGRGEARTAARRAAIADLMRDPEPEAAIVLTRRAIRDPARMAIVVECLLEGEDCSRFRTVVCEAGWPDALRAQLTSSDPARRGRAALALGALDAPEAPSVLEPLLRDADYDVRHAAVRALALTRNEHAAWAYVRALRDGLLAPERVLEQLGPWAAEAFSEACHIGELRPIRAVLAEGLGLCGDPHAGPALAAVLSRGDDEERVRACRAIGRTGDPRLGAYLTRALGDVEWIVRAQAAAALARLGGADADAIELLESLLADPAWWVRANAAEALLAAGPNGIAALARAAHAADRFARDRAREALELERVRLEAAA